MNSNSNDVDYRDLAIYIVQNLYEIFKSSDLVFINPYKAEDKLLKEFKLEFCSFANEEVYSLSYKLLMELYNDGNIKKIEKRLSKINENILNKRNSLIFLEYLVNILNKDIESYQKDCIKLNILILLLYLSRNDCQRLICSNGYFNICINELKEIYKDIEPPKTSDKDNEIKEKYKNQKVKSFYSVLREVESYFKTEKNYEELEKINNYFNKYRKKEINSNNIEEYINQNDKYFFIYIEKYCKKFHVEMKKEDYERLKIILFFLNDLDRISCYLEICLNEDFEILKKFNESYEPISISQQKEEDLTEDLKKIISSNDFYEKLKEILKSKAVQDYMIKKRKFNNLVDKKLKDYYNFSFVDELKDIELKEDDNNNIDDLKNEYAKFMEYYDKKDWFKSIITYKYLPNGIRGFVNQTMIIAINPLFIKKSSLFLTEEDIQKKDKILSSYLIIILVHEIIHLLKFLKKKKYEKIEELPSTPKGKEGGEMFINYLFCSPIINKINRKQAEKILDINNWNNLSNLHLIFPTENLAEDKEDNDEYYISFYITNINEENEDNVREFTKF